MLFANGTFFGFIVLCVPHCVHVGNGFASLCMFVHSSVCSYVHCFRILLHTSQNVHLSHFGLHFSYRIFEQHFQLFIVLIFFFCNRSSCCFFLPFSSRFLCFYSLYCIAMPRQLKWFRNKRNSSLKCCETCAKRPDWQTNNLNSFKCTTTVTTSSLTLSTNIN